MKNLFKNLMLVAVAAMAFTACQNDNNEVNEVAKKTVISGVLSFDEETRSGFVGKNEAGNAYVSEWDGGETIKLFAENGLETTATVDAEGKFTAQFEGELPESFYMTVCSPAESWSSQSTSTIPAEQTPRANSVDPAAHILKAQNVYVTNGSADTANMGHEVAYGKMTVNGVDFDIDHVVIDLKGSYYGSTRELSYTINADNVENNTFWFATEPIDVAEFTVTAYDAEGNAVAKTVDVAEAGKTMSFAYGRVGTFSVSGLEAPAEPEAPAKVFTSAEVSTAYDLNDYEICFKDQEGKEFYVEFYYEDGTYVIENDILKEGTYVLDEFDGDNGLYYVNYDGIGFSCATVIVSHVEGLYNIQFTNLKKWDWDNGVWTDVPFEEAVYTGGIIGLSNPDGSAPTPTPDPEPDPEPEPESPKFTRAVVVINWGSNDQIISFSGEALGTLEVEFYDQNVAVLNTDNWLNEGEYSIVQGTRNKLWYAKFTDATHNEATVIDITITVAWVNGKYHITFENVGGNNYETFFESAVFVGSITGGSIEDPDRRTRLDRPVVEAVPSEVEPAITFSWNAVDNAIEYELIFDGQTYTTTELSKTFSGLDYFKTYEVSVVAVADVNSETYRNSEAAIAKARTMKDPNGPEIDPNAFTSCNYVSSFDSEGWGRKYEFSNESGAYLWLWVVEAAADESTGFMNAGIYNYHNAWADSVSYPGFVVKRMLLPGSSEESYIIGANMSVERNGDNHEIAFDITLEGETEPRTYTFSGAINKTF